MPMVLRSRRSIRVGKVGEGEEAPLTPRRSTRLGGRHAAAALVEEADDSDSDSVLSQVMERDQSVPPQLEEEVAEETTTTEVKDCAVVLDRLRPEEESPKNDLEEKDDMSRRSTKPVSRIPTFHKRPSSGSQNTELPLSKRDPPSHAAQPPEKAGSGTVEGPKSRVPGVREMMLPLPSVRISKIGVEASPLASSTEQAAASTQSYLGSAPKSWSDEHDSGVHPLMAVSPRPALRPQHVSYCASEVEADTLLDDPGRQLVCEGSLSQKPEEETDQAGACRVREENRFGLGAAVDDERFDSAEIVQTIEESFCEVTAITDEEPPWETGPTNILELEEDNESSSDVPCADDVAVESGVSDSGEMKDDCEQQTSQENDQSDSSNLSEEIADIDESPPPAESNKPSKATSHSSTKRSACCSFALFCFLPTTLLLLGGFGQHVWHYGLPLSVAQLLSQLELHWLEGCGLVPEPCSVDCRVHLVESTPVGLYPSTPSSLHSTADSWLTLLDKANSSVHIAAFYFSLRNIDSELSEPADSQGRQVFEQLKLLESKGVKLQIAVNAPQTSTRDTAELAAAGAEVREVDLQSVTGGIVHTKLWVVDQKHLYLGSANMDWRSLTEVKEVGLSVEDCSCLAQDAFRIFGVYWSLGAKNASLPPYWPARFSALSSSQDPLRLKFNGVPAQVYLSSAPPQISARGRSDDLATILSVIADAKEFIHISVMDYLPLSQYIEPVRFWPAIDSALRAAACTRGVQVRLLVSCWPHSTASMFTFLQSLLVLNRSPLRCDIQVKVFTVRSTAEQIKIPHARVNHAKYMVTDRVLYIGTSNWSENYFTHTAGAGLVVNQTGSAVGKGQRTLQSQAEELFLRDWSSEYAGALPDGDVDVCPLGRH